MQIQVRKMGLINVNWKEIEWFQGGLKDMTKEGFKKLKTSIPTRLILSKM